MTSNVTKLQEKDFVLKLLVERRNRAATKLDFKSSSRLDVSYERLTLAYANAAIARRLLDRNLSQDEPNGTHGVSEPV